MKVFIAALLFVLAASAATAATLAELCELRRAEQNDPGMTLVECRRQMLILGAYWYGAEQSKRAADIAKRTKIREDRTAIRENLPMPTPIPAAPTPTVEPTVEPTVKPTVEPTVEPTAPPTATPMP